MWAVHESLPSRLLTIADISLVAYLYYPAEEFGFDIAAEHRNISLTVGE